MRTTEGNKLIANFVGAKYLPEHDVWDFADTNPFPLVSGPYTSKLRYHWNWDWLMGIVEKIDSILADDDFVTISYNRCMIEVHNPEFIFPDKEVESISIEGFGNTRIEATWNAVCEFIEWYNENK